MLPPSAKIKIISNIFGLENVQREGLDIEFCRYPKTIQSFSTVVRMFIKSFHYDYIILNFTSFDILLLAFFKLIIPFNRCRLVTIDLLLTRPITLRERLLHPLKMLVLKKVHLFLVLMKNTNGYQNYFHLRPQQFRYLPYKINAFKLISITTVTDDKYIFCGGKSRRDFKSLFDAVRDLPYPVKIVTVSNQELAIHGSILDDSLIPANVEVIRHDGSVELFVKYLAAAHLVVIPIKKDILTQAGIAVYIMAMALKKCVIISSGPGVEDVLGYDKAIIVPPEDPIALKEVISRAYNDHEYRKQFELNGYNYAMSLGDEERLKESIISIISDDYSKDQS
jgi:glycosyltransferase involved in cell wall biosynthesis